MRSGDDLELGPKCIRASVCPYERCSSDPVLNEVCAVAGSRLFEYTSGLLTAASESPIMVTGLQCSADVHVDAGELP